MLLLEGFCRVLYIQYPICIPVGRIFAKKTLVDSTSSAELAKKTLVDSTNSAGLAKKTLVDSTSSTELAKKNTC